jgi:hypothetical protein
MIEVLMMAQVVRQTTHKACTPKSSQPPPLNSPFLPPVVVKGCGSSAKSPTARTPHMDDSPWTELAPTGSSTPILSKKDIVVQAITPPIAPTSTASQVLYKKQPAENFPINTHFVLKKYSKLPVIATRAPRTPLMRSMISKCPPLVRLE